MNRREALQAGLGLAVGAVTGVALPVHSGVVGRSVLAAAKARVFEEKWLMRVYNLGALTPRQVQTMEGSLRYIRPKNDGIAVSDSPQGPFKNICDGASEKA